jgi:hypothetical protein
MTHSRIDTTEVNGAQAMEAVRDLFRRPRVSVESRKGPIRDSNPYCKSAYAPLALR